MPYADPLTDDELTAALEGLPDWTRDGVFIRRSVKVDGFSHKSITVNGETVTIPSFQCKAGDVVAVREKAQKQLRIQTALQIKGQVGFPAWVEVDEKKFTGTFKQVPDREEILPEINENLVVELYSK